MALPVLPLVASTIVSPGLSWPLRSACSIMYFAIRALIEPDGFMNSSLAYTPSTLTSGVSPTASRIEGDKWGKRTDMALISSSLAAAGHLCTTIHRAAGTQIDDLSPRRFDHTVDVAIRGRRVDNIANSAGRSKTARHPDPTVLPASACHY